MYYVFPVQGLVESNYRFIPVSIVSVGSCHDSSCMDSSNLGSYLEENIVPAGFLIAGDDAYICMHDLMTPIS